LFTVKYAKERGVRKEQEEKAAFLDRVEWLERRPS
jgi:hypothetical protein